MRFGVMQVFSYKTSMTVLLSICFGVAFSVQVVTSAAETAPIVRYEDNRLSVQANHAPLLLVLQEIAKATGIDIFVSPDIKSIPITISIEQSLDRTLGNILRDFSYTVSYTKDKAKDNSWRILDLQIFTKGQRQGELLPVLAGMKVPPTTSRDTITSVRFYSDEELATFGSLGQGGLLVPSQSVAKPGAEQSLTESPLLVLQLQFEREETRLFEEQLYLQRQIAHTTDEDKKAALEKVYADTVDQFQTMKAAHLNKIEALKRIQHAQGTEEN
jgi:hypothetical protein